MSLRVFVVGGLPRDLSDLDLSPGEPVVILTGAKDDVRAAGALLYQDVTLAPSPSTSSSLQPSGGEAFLAPRASTDPNDFDGLGLDGLVAEMNNALLPLGDLARDLDRSGRCVARLQRVSRALQAMALAEPVPFDPATLPEPEGEAHLGAFVQVVYLPPKARDTMTDDAPFVTRAFVMRGAIEPDEVPDDGPQLWISDEFTRPWAKLTGTVWTVESFPLLAARWLAARGRS